MFHVGRSAEVTQQDSLLRRDQNVCRFKVSVDNTKMVHVSYRLHKLIYKLKTLTHAQPNSFQIIPIFLSLDT